MANRLLVKTLKISPAAARRLSSATTPPIAAVLPDSTPPQSPPPPSSSATAAALLDFRNSNIFSPVATSDLIRSSINLGLSAIEPVADLGSWLMRSRMMDVPGIRPAVVAAVRRTFFRQFCAGESVEEAALSVERLWRSGLRGMLSYGVEHADDNESCDRNFLSFLRTIRSASSLPPSSVSSVVVKITAICRISLLRRVSDLLRWEHKDPSFKLPWKRRTLPIFASSSPLHHTPTRPDPLTPDEELDLEFGHRRLESLCHACLQADVPLIIDAEDTSLQPSIDYLSYSAALASPGKDGKVVLYGTIQAYLKDARERLRLACGAAEEAGVAVGFKLVRGAYMSSERMLARSLGVPSPVHDSIQDTHDCYNDCVNMLLDKIAAGSSSHLVLATHNLQSGKLAAVKAQELGIRKDGEQLQFAQLYGMSDALSLGLKTAGFNVSKYMTFGPVEKVIPYLLRRAEENRGRDDLLCYLY
uniref:Proline dehydrogenase n=1 Tax=Kalanchoe fedtschenkoi TaxID=63787 RepID=A0A7N0TQQ4_KALFE